MVGSEKADIVLANLNQVVLCAAGYAATCKYAVHQANANIAAACICLCYLQGCDQNGMHWTTPVCVQSLGSVAMTRCCQGLCLFPSVQVLHNSGISAAIYLSTAVCYRAYGVELLVQSLWCYRESIYRDNKDRLFNFNLSHRQTHYTTGSGGTRTYAMPTRQYQ